MDGEPWFPLTPDPKEEDIEVKEIDSEEVEIWGQKALSTGLISHQEKVRRLFDYWMLSWEIMTSSDKLPGHNQYVKTLSEKFYQFWLHVDQKYDFFSLLDLDFTVDFVSGHISKLECHVKCECEKMDNDPEMILTWRRQNG